MTVAVASDAQGLGKSLTRLMEIAFGFVNSQALLSAHELGVFETLGNDSMSLDALASRIGLSPVACKRLLMVLVALDLVERHGDGFRNTELGRLCSSASSVNLGAIAKINPFYHMFEHLTGALREYSPRWQQALGTTPQDAFATLYADPLRLREFADLMNAISVPQGRLIAEAFDFTPYGCIMDVAGGPGGQSIEIGLKHTHLRGIIMDMEPVCVVAREQIAAKGLSSRFTAVAGDLMTGPYPTGADVILLGHILHDWSDETCRRILRHSAAALPDDGLLLISESVLGEDFAGRQSANVKDLIMLVANEPDARERTLSEYGGLLDEAGFDIVDVIRFEAPRDLIVARKRKTHN
jgi:O-methyltransferase domain/Dimerisation domain